MERLRSGKLQRRPPKVSPSRTRTLHQLTNVLTYIVPVTEEQLTKNTHLSLMT